VTIRVPAVAGEFYEDTEDNLRREIERSFLHRLGPGRIPEEKGTNRALKAVISPHAGFIYSGPVAAHTFSAIFEDGEPEVFVILGPNHRGSGADIAVWNKGSWKTPLGEVKVDEKVAAEIINQSEYAKSDEQAHKLEHSIEVQLPFLQILFPNAKFVPICMNTDPIYHRSMLTNQDIITKNWKLCSDVGKEIAAALEILDIDGLVIASSDFTHFESAKNAKRKDDDAITKILSLDDENFTQSVSNQSASICGYAPIITSMAFAKERGATSGKLLKYTTSGDITGDNGQVVAYSSIIFQ